MNIDKTNLEKLNALQNKKVLKIVESFAELCKPDKTTVITDSEDDINYVRELSLKNKEEIPLKKEGHTVHFDGYSDQARDKENTKILVPEGTVLGRHIKIIDREAGLKEIYSFFDGAMKGKEMLVRFFCLGPLNSRFSIPALQITDSAYVAHSEDLLYRSGYEAFKQLKNKDEFFYFIHSAGELENYTSKHTDKRRVYIDLEQGRVLSVNTQYAGNTIGLKKLALRLTIKKAIREDWLCEHMFISGIHNKGRVTYFTGAFPSACGKTSTAMLPGNTIIGDDIAYIRPRKDGRAYAVNVEKGIFGIIQDVNPNDDPIIYEALISPEETIFSNVLIKDQTPFWLGMGRELPKEGTNFSDEWQEGKKDPDGKEIPPAHKNARYTIRLSGLKNVDANLDNPGGVPVSGFIYGGRDSDTNIPVFQSLDWSHGVFTGTCLESETTAATLGKEGERKHNPMANLDFLVIHISVYIEAHLKFGRSLDNPPLIFGTNYFLKENGKYLNGMMDKKVWLHWMELRVHNEVGVIKTPIGFIPKYEDLKILFEKLLNKEYNREDYEKQFAIRIPQLLAKLDRIETFYKDDKLPESFYTHLNAQRQRLIEAKKRFGKDNILPSDFNT